VAARSVAIQGIGRFAMRRFMVLVVMLAVVVLGIAGFDARSGATAQ
jgi:hypothetical protein